MKQVWGFVFSIALMAVGCTGTSSDNPGQEVPDGADDTLEIDESTSDDDDAEAPDELEIDEVTDDSPEVVYPEEPAAVDDVDIPSCLADAFSRGCAEEPQHEGFIVC